MSSIIQLIKAVESTIGYGYVAIVDDATCQKCLGNEGKIFTQDEIEQEFEYAEPGGGNLWLPNVHPNCRCQLIGYEVPDAEDSETPKQMSDKQYEDWLSGLLAAGQIGAAVYDGIMARRKKKKEQEQTK